MNYNGGCRYPVHAHKEENKREIEAREKQRER